MGTTIDIGTISRGESYTWKDPSWVGEDISINPTGPVSMDTPTFVIDYNSSYVTCNYCYCPLFQRYYFITDKVIDIGKTITLVCKSDPLATFFSTMPALMAGIDCCVIRTGATNKAINKLTYFPDPTYPIDPARKVLSHIEFTPNLANGVYPLESEDYNYIVDILKSDGTPFTPPTTPTPNP